MPDPRAEKWATALVNYSVTGKPGQTVAISGGVASEPLLRTIKREVTEGTNHSGIDWDMIVGPRVAV